MNNDVLGLLLALGVFGLIMGLAHLGVKRQERQQQQDESDDLKDET